MSIRAPSQIHAPLSFVVSVRNVYAFLQRDDALHAEERYCELLAQLAKARERLTWNPASGRPARVLSMPAAQARVFASRARVQAESVGAPEIRELNVRPYLLLYAHGDNQVFFLALRHERQLND